MPTDNILEAKEKFDRMFKEIQTKKSNLETEILTIRQKVSDLNAQKNVQRALLEELNDDYYKHRAQSDETLQMLKVKLDTASQERNRLENRETQVTEQKNQAYQESIKLKESQRERETRDHVRADLLKDEMDKVNTDIAIKEAAIEELKTRIAEYKTVLEGDIRFVLMKEDNIRLTKELKQKELDNNSLNYKSFEFDNLQKLAIKQKELDTEERRKLTDEYDRLKKLHDDTTKMNELRVERMIRENEPEEIRQLRARLKIEEIHLEDTKDKWSNVNIIYTKFKTDLNHRTAEAAEFSTIIASVKANIEKYEAELQSIDPDVVAFKAQADDLQKNVDAKSELKRKLINNQQENERILEGLKAKYLYLGENFDLSKMLNNINLDELKHVMNSNSNVNNTITQLLNQWGNIQEFSTGHLNTK